MEKDFYVYILASGKHGTLYTGMTSNLQKRIWEHKEKIIKGFTATYNITKLVYFEHHETWDNAATREKRIKDWKRDWKINLIEEHNPEWLDLYGDLGPSHY